MKAYLKNYRQAPRKVRLVADLIKGKDVTRALLILETTTKRATRQLKSLVNSAIANAKDTEGAEAADLFIQQIRVDKGLTMRRYMPKAHGRATRFDKHSSNIILELGSRKPGAEKKADDAEAPAGKAKKSAPAKAAKPAAAKKPAKKAAPKKKPAAAAKTS